MRRQKSGVIENAGYKIIPTSYVKKLRLTFVVMRIAVDARFLESNERPELRDFTKKVFVRLAVQYPAHNFIFFTDTGFVKKTDLPQNVITEVLTPGTTNFLLQKAWFDIMLPIALKKHKADLFIGSYGVASLTTSIPQLLVVRDMDRSKKGILSIAGIGSRLIKKAKVVVCVSEFVREKLSAKFKLQKEAIKVIGSGASEFFKPIEWEEKEAIKEQYAEGCEYFVFTGGLQAENNLLTVLQAFSIFKKWQKTNMKLLVTGSFANDEKKIVDKLKTYKYRAEVFLRKDKQQNEMAAIVVASYAMIYTSLSERFALPVLEAMKSNVPVIANGISSIIEIAGDAALYADPTKPNEIAEQMKRIFKDEQLRNKLILTGMERATFYNWDNTARLVWKAIEETVSK